MAQAEFTLSAFGDEIDPDLDRQLDVLQAEGIDHLELRGAWGKNVSVLDDAEIDRVRTALKARGMNVSAIGSPIGKIQITDPFEPEVTRFKRILEIAKKLNSRYIRLFSFYIPPNMHSRYRDEVLRRMETLVVTARPHNIILLHENEKGIYGDTHIHCADLFNTLMSYNLRAIFDPANFVQCGVKPFSEAYPMLEGHIEYLHIKDALMADGQVVVAGQGDGEFEPLLKALRKKGWRGFASLEPHLESAGPYGGFSGAELFHEAASAFKKLLGENYA